MELFLKFKLYLRQTDLFKIKLFLIKKKYLDWFD